MQKNILITGSTDGIGKLTAIELAKKGHSVYIHGRSPEKVQTAVMEIKKITQNENITGFVADFSNLESVKKMASEIKEKVSSLDVLINNAGVYKSASTYTESGLDIRFAVNYLAPYLLTQELLSLLAKKEGARIINLSSAAQSSVSHQVLSGEKSLSQGESYAQSKLALTMWSFYSAKQNPSLLIIAVNPGSLLNTKMAQEAFGQHWSPANKGSDILCKLATLDEYKEMSGTYFDNDKGNFAKAHPDTYEDEKIKRLIQTTRNILNLN